MRGRDLCRPFGALCMGSPEDRITLRFSRDVVERGLHVQFNAVSNGVGYATGSSPFQPAIRGQVLEMTRQLPAASYWPVARSGFDNRNGKANFRLVDSRVDMSHSEAAPRG